MKRNNFKVLLLISFAAVVILAGAQSFGANELKPLIKSVENAQHGLTIWQMLKSGGPLIIGLGILSIISLSIVIFDFIMLKTEKLCPRDIAEELVKLLEQKKGKAALKVCESNPNILTGIVKAGLEAKAKGNLFAKEAMESTARREIGKLWQNIGYLGDIVVIAPLVGLLGTITGMIRAFSVIVVQSSVVKPIMLAGGISEAMVNTAGGLVVAIVTMIFHSYFRGKIQEVTGAVETYSNVLVKLVEEI